MRQYTKVQAEPTFLLLVDTDGDKVVVNMDKIKYMKESKSLHGEPATMIEFAQGSYIFVKNPLAEVVGLITERKVK